MHIRCPHCHNAIEVVEDSSFRDVSCPSCGSHFNLVGGDAPTETGPTAPRRVAHFELIEQLGVGNFGTVWKAKDTTLDRFVAVKIPRSDQLAEADVEKFFREARAAAQLRNANIVAVHEVGRDGNTIFIASDYVEGATLKEWLRGQPLPPREAAELCAKIADALHAAHEAGVVHRDLKPSNIMMDMHDEPHIMDFGLAKRESGEFTITLDGALLGTPAYMPPEQAAGKGHEADRRADVYSLGVILFEILTGELPFRGEKRMLLVQIQRDEPPSPHRLNGNVPRDLETVCLKCLEKDPNKRYATAQYVGDELRRYLAGEPIHARPVTVAGRGWRWCMRYPVVSGLATALLLALIGGLYGVSSQWIRADRLAEQRRRERYISDMNAAMLAWNENNLTEFKNLLSRYFPQAEEPDLRKWEWYHMWRLGEPYFKARRIELPDVAQGVVFVPKYNLLAVAHGFAPVVSLWNLEPASCRAQWGYAQSARWIETFVAVSPDGERIAYPGPEGRGIRLRDTADNNGPERDLAGYSVRTTSAAFLPDCTHLVTGDTDGEVRIWDIESQRVEVTFHVARSVDPEPLSPQVSVSQDGALVAAGDETGEVKVWDTSTKQEVRSYRHGGIIRSIAFCPHGSYLAVAGENVKTLSLLHLDSRGKDLILEGHDDDIFCTAFSPDGKLLASGGYDRTIRIWNTHDGSLSGVFKGHTGSVRGLTFSPDGKSLASASLDQSVLVWNLREGSAVGSARVLTLYDSQTFKGDNWRPQLALSPGSDLMATLAYDHGATSDGAMNNVIRLWDVRTFEEKPVSIRPSERILSFAVSPTDDLLATGGMDGSVKLWSLATGELKETLREGSHAEVTALTFSPDGAILASGTAVGELKLWRAGEHRMWTTLPLDSEGDTHTAAVVSLAFQNGGRMLASAHGESVLLWDIGDAVTQRTSLSVGFGCGLNALMFSPNGQTLAAGTAFRGIFLWDLSALQERPLILPTPARSLLFSADGKTLFFGGNRPIIKLWDVDMGAQRCTLTGHTSAVGALAMSMSADGKTTTLISASWDGTVHAWRAATRESADPVGR